MKRGTYLLLLMLSSQIVLAIGITPASYEVDFQPNLKRDLYFQVTDVAQPVKIVVQGDLSEYLSTEPTTLTSAGSFIATLNLPEKIDTPGKHQILVGASETTAEPGSTIGAITGINGLVILNVPFKGKYLFQPNLYIPSINQFEKAQATIDVKNFGTEKIGTLFAVINIFDLSGNKLLSVTTNPISLESLAGTIISAELNSENLSPGEYKGKATVFYDDQQIETNEATFSVGKLTVETTNYTKNVFQDQINEFEIEVASKWNNHIEDIFANAIVTNKGLELTSFKTLNTDLNAWETKKLVGYLDASNIAEGIYDIKFELNYNNQIKEETGRISILKKQEELSPTTIVLIIVIALIALTNAYWFIKVRLQKKHYNNRETKASYKVLFSKK